MPYHKPANQNECIFLMTNKVHGTHLMLLGFSISSRRYFTYEILSYETVDPILNILHFQCF